MADLNSDIKAPESTDKMTSPKEDLANSLRQIFEPKQHSERYRFSPAEETKAFQDTWKLMENRSRPEIEEALQANYKTDKQSIEKVLRQRLAPEHADRIMKLVEDKGHSDIPAENRMEAKNLLKGDRNIKPGELNHISLPDGRQYDAYIPKTVHQMKDGTVPTILTLHGVEKSFENNHHMQDTTGMNQIADRLGVVVLYPIAKARTFDGTKDPDTLISKIGSLGTWINDKLNSSPLMAWNAGKNDLLPSDASYSDINYQDQVLADARSFFPISQKVGIEGHSDGGRFSQVYAKERSENVAALAAFTSTYLKDAELPTKSLPFWSVVGERDTTFNLNEEMTWKTYGYSQLLASTMNKQMGSLAPGEIWAKAGQCTDKQTNQIENGIKEIQFSGGPDCDVKTTVIRDHGHAIPSWRNKLETGRHMGFLTVVNHDYDYSLKVAQWLKGHIVNSSEGSKK